MKNHPMMWRVLSLVVVLFAAMSLTFAPVLAPNFNLTPVFAGEDDDDDDKGKDKRKNRDKDDDDDSVAFPNSADRNAHGFARKLTAARWQWLEDTYWYVPDSNLLAYVYDVEANQMSRITDQTVYNITDYDSGYFWGKTAVKLESFPDTMCLSLVGSITPEGQVFLTFTSIDPVPGAAPTQGIGQMRFKLKFGGWTMENQMSSGPIQLQVSHWAYMVQGQPGDSLPAVGISIEDFLAQCPDGPQQ